MSDTAKPTKDLGSANGWAKSPPEFVAHQAAKHLAIEQKIGRCTHRYTCEACGITWTVDSSD